MDSVVKANLAQIKILMQSHGVVNAYLFGSAATDEMTNESDVDFLVRFDPGLNYTDYGNNYFRLIYALQNLLDKDVDLIAEETITNPYLLRNINNNRIAFL